MRFKRLRSKIDELRDITSSWCDGEEVSLLEMDMALDRVKQIYELLRFEGNDEVAIGGEVAEDEISAVAVEVVEQEELQEELQEDECVEQPMEQIVEDVAEDSDIALATEEDVVLNKRERYNRICSLYADDAEEEAATEETPEVDIEPAPEEDVVVDEPVSEEPIQLQTSEPATQIEEEAQPEAQPNIYPSMSEGLTLNDRFLLLNDLFNNDMDELMDVIKQLDKQSSYDDAIIYIAENYSWDGASDGAQIMITLLKSRFKS